MTSNNSGDGDGNAFDPTANSEVYNERHTDENVHKTGERMATLDICILVTLAPFVALAIAPDVGIIVAGEQITVQRFV